MKPDTELIGEARKAIKNEIRKIKDEAGGDVTSLSQFKLGKLQGLRHAKIILTVLKNPIK